jgi:hypothetical protein
MWKHTSSSSERLHHVRKRREFGLNEQRSLSRLQVQIRAGDPEQLVHRN